MHSATGTGVIGPSQTAPKLKPAHDRPTTLHAPDILRHPDPMLVGLRSKTSLDLSEVHPDSVPRPQDDHRTRFDHLARNQPEFVFFQQNTQNHEDLQHGVVAADTAARPG